MPKASGATGDSAAIPDPAELGSRLLAWFEREGRSLPWRGETDPYRIWVSEIMLQQTQAATVLHYYRRWLIRFPNLHSLARGDLTDVLKAWEGLGYYSRARNLHRAAQILLERYGGVLPSRYDALKELPGIGDYTAAAIASIAFGEEIGVVDGNVVRVVTRILAEGGDIRSPGLKKRLCTFVESSFGQHHPGWINQAWMELGALVCRPRPACRRCPLALYCRALALDRVLDFPAKGAGGKVPLRQGALFIVLKSYPAPPEEAGPPAPPLPPAADSLATGRLVLESGSPLLLVRRRPEGLLGGLWEFPNINLQDLSLDRFTASNRLRIRQDTGLEVRQRYSHFEIAFAILLADCIEETRLAGWAEQRWVPPSELSSFPRPRVHIRVMKLLGLTSRSG